MSVGVAHEAGPDVHALAVEALGVATTSGNPRQILHDISFTLHRGSAVGLVGQSGAGKSTVGNALIGLLPPGLALTPKSRVLLNGEPLCPADAVAMRRIRGRRLAMVFQEPLTALDPAMRIGEQLGAALRAHALAFGADADDRAVEMLDRVGISEARAAARRFPHELSGGMRQRLLLAMALLLEPDVLIADEPTTSLDVTLQAQLLDLLDALRAETGTALLLISHDLAVVGERCERVLWLDNGHLVDDGPAPRIIATRRAATPVRASVSIPAVARAASAPHPIAEVRDLAVHFDAPSGLRPRISGIVRAVDGVSLAIASGECVGLVGESGCGKSTLARSLLGLVPPTHGEARFDGQDLGTLQARTLRALRRRMQLVPQDAGASLTPQRTVRALVAEVLEVHGIASGDEASRRADALLANVGLDASFGERYPIALSSGERQRVAIARALAPEPEFLVCDEPVANVDAETRERILALIERLRAERGLAVLLISHDIAVVRRLASRVAVMYLGRVVESATMADALDDPWMPYTQVLRTAVPTGDPARRHQRPTLRGEFPSPLHPPAGCAFHPRCPHPARDASCQVSRPELVERAPGRWVACHKAAGLHLAE